MFTAANSFSDAEHFDESLKNDPSPRTHELDGAGQRIARHEGREM